jgi:acyl carrier protein
MKSRYPGSGALTIDQALSWFAEVLDESQSDVRPETVRADLTGWDSLGHLVLMSALDERFGIKLTRSELASLTSIQSILDVLARHGRLVTP